MEVPQSGGMFRLQFLFLVNTVCNASIITGSVVMDSTSYSSPFLRSVSDAIRVRHYSRSTEKTYIGWVKRFIYFHNKRHPREMGRRRWRRF